MWLSKERRCFKVRIRNGPRDEPSQALSKPRLGGSRTGNTRRETFVHSPTSWTAGSFADLLEIKSPWKWARTTWAWSRDDSLGRQGPGSTFSSCKNRAMGSLVPPARNAPGAAIRWSGHRSEAAPRAPTRRSGPSSPAQTTRRERRSGRGRRGGDAGARPGSGSAARAPFSLRPVEGRGGRGLSPSPSPHPTQLRDPSRSCLSFPLSLGETWPGALRRRQTTGEA